MTDLCEYCCRPLSLERRTGSERTDARIIRYHGGCRDMIDAGTPSEAIMAQHAGIMAERRARQMNAELPSETRAMMQLKGMM